MQKSQHMRQRDRSRVSVEATSLPAECGAGFMNHEINVDEMLSASWDQLRSVGAAAAKAAVNATTAE
jgi:hypothetical protein